MKMMGWLLSLCLLPCAFAQQAPWARPDIPISSHDRVYAADQTSNTVSVIDPAENKLLGVIRLGDPVPGALSPLYKGQLLVHGLGYSPDSKTLAVVSVGYADGFLRAASASNARPGAEAIVARLRCPMAGRVSMDLIAIDVTDIPEGRAKRGDLITLLGAEIGVDELAARAGTIGYEVLTSLGRRYRRIYRP